MRREGDSNPRYALGVYTLSRRASSTTRASLPFTFFWLKSNAFHPSFYGSPSFQLQMYSFYSAYTSFFPI